MFFLNEVFFFVGNYGCRRMVGVGKYKDEINYFLDLVRTVINILEGR